MSTPAPSQAGAVREGRDGCGPRHFLELRDHDGAHLRHLIEAARSLKDAQQRDPAARLRARALFTGRTLGLMMGKPSTRTRVSFEVAMRQLGGDVIALSPRDTQLGRGESVADTARVLSRFLDVLVVRIDDPAQLRELVAHSTIPIVNGLTSASHPVQILADILTFEEHRGPITGRTVAWCGDGNNVAASWIEAAVRFGFTLRLAVPPALAPDPGVLGWAEAQIGGGHAAAGAAIVSCPTAADAVAGADCVVTDTWVSMSDDPLEDRRHLLEPYRVDESLMSQAAPDALFMHCLPAHRGEEVTEGVIDGRWSVVFDEAENRLHAQKALLAWILGGRDWASLIEQAGARPDSRGGETRLAAAGGRSQ